MAQKPVLTHVLREQIKSLLLGSPVSRTLDWAEEHENGNPLGDVVERMMYPSRDEDDCAGTDIEVWASPSESIIIFARPLAT
jgi:hypothetical protein